MAEALLKKYYPNQYQAFSAGTEPTKVNPYTRKVLEEEGIDTSSLYSKHAKEFVNQEIDLVVTVCDHAKETCPVFPYAKKSLHKNFQDPASFKGNEQETLEHFREIKNQIKNWLVHTFLQVE